MSRIFSPGRQKSGNCILNVEGKLQHPSLYSELLICKGLMVSLKGGAAPEVSMRWHDAQVLALLP